MSTTIGSSSILKGITFNGGTTVTSGTLSASGISS